MPIRPDGARPPVGLRGKRGGRAPFSSLGDEAAQPRDWAQPEHALAWSALRGEHGAVHLPQDWARKLRNRGMASPESRYPHPGMCRLAARLTTFLGPSQSEQTPPDGNASLSPARTGLDQRADVKMAGSTVGRTVVPRGITSSSAGELRI